VGSGIHRGTWPGWRDETGNPSQLRLPARALMYCLASVWRRCQRELPLGALAE